MTIRSAGLKAARSVAMNLTGCQMRIAVRNAAWRTMRRLKCGRMRR